MDVKTHGGEATKWKWEWGRKGVREWVLERGYSHEGGWDHESEGLRPEGGSDYEGGWELEGEKDDGWVWERLRVRLG